MDMLLAFDVGRIRSDRAPRVPAIKDHPRGIVKPSLFAKLESLGPADA
jgi:hypothetical protein